MKYSIWAKIFSSEEGLQYISGDADGDGTETGTGKFYSA